jgi:hypothetical protein
MPVTRWRQQRQQNSQRHGNTAATARASSQVARAPQFLHRACILLPQALPPNKKMALSRTRLAPQSHTATGIRTPFPD